MRVDMDAVDDLAATWFRVRGGQPGLAYGIVAGGELVHSGGLGVRWLGGHAPDAATVFGIASMTKSFTAAAIMLLRDQTGLRLDDSAADYVTELASLRLPASDCPPVTIRQLLTMTAGFPTDDPWGDRQQGLDPAVFARLLADGGVRCGWAPGTRFEYSNLGYAILGKVIESVTGQGYLQAVRAHLLAPLGLDRTGYEVTDFEPGQLARGYRRDGTGWLELAPDGCGAFAPMGGVFSCVTDLARWVAGFTDAFPARDDVPEDAAGRSGLDSGAGDLGHPLRRASRREMQLAQVSIPAGGDGVAVRFAGPPALSYGFGLFVEDDPVFGSIVQHSGGYPGYGSNMRWHPATGLGAIVLANGTYAPVSHLAQKLLATVLGAAEPTVRSGGCRMSGPVPRAGGPWPETLAAREAVNGLLHDWDDAVARWLFAPNVDLDQPIAQRRADISRVRERIGEFRSDGGRPPECDSPAHCRWWLTGPGGTVAAEIRLAPLYQALVQELMVAVPPVPESSLGLAVTALTTQLNAGAPAWPAEVPAAAGLDTDEVLRQLRMAAVWAGPCELDSYLAGDGATSATIRLAGPTGRVELSLQVSDSGALVRAGISLAAVS